MCFLRPSPRLWPLPDLALSLTRAPICIGRCSTKRTPGDEGFPCEDRWRAALAGYHEDTLPRLDVIEAVLKLSTRQRAAVLLTYWADLSPAGVADRLGTSEGSVRRHLARARAHLRRILDE
jgi:DNA-directed RNA polymerase specialized sigma24 family protein